MVEAQSGEWVRSRLVRALTESDRPVSTAELRESVGGVVNEVVYRNLVILEQRGKVTRLPRAGRHTTWAVRS